MEPVLKWAGGKRQLLTKIKSHIELNGGRYYEPFVGGGALCFDMEYENSVINDINSELINVYNVIKNNPAELISKLSEHKNNYCHNYFYEVRGWDRRADYKDLDNISKAARIIFLNRTCYNGLYRVNSKGFFNVPIGRYKNPDIIMKKRINQLSELLNNEKFVIRNTDFEESVADAKSGDYIYFDPPYDYDGLGFTSYNSEGFDHEQLLRLRNVCVELIKRGCHVIISNNDTAYVNELFNLPCFTIEHIEANRYIGSNSNSRKKVGEVIIYG